MLSVLSCSPWMRRTTDNEDPLRIWVGVDEDEDVDKDEDVDEDEDEDCEDDELTRQVVDVGIC